jgi:very-short-patch-repair endonuclease
VDVAQTLASCGKTTQGLAAVAQLRAAGLSPAGISRALRADAIVRVHRRVYALAPLPGLTRFVVTDAGVSPEYVAHVRAALMSLGPGAAARCRTAAAVRGWAMLVEPARTLEIAVPHGSRRPSLKGVDVTERRRLSCEVLVALAETAPIAVTSAVQTVIDCALSLSLLQAVVICDSALRARDVTVEGLRAAARALPGVRDAGRVRQVLDLCDPESGSVLETVLRVRMLLDGIIGFATQQVLLDGLGQHVLRADFVFAEAKLVVEVDGEKWHQDPTRDRKRDNTLAALGWRVLRYRWAEVVHEPRVVLDEIRDAIRTATSDGQSVAAPMGAAA